MTVAFKLGSVGQDGVTGLRSMFVRLTTASRYMTPHTSGTTDYVVPEGKTFYITKISLMGGGALSSISIGYGDDAVAEGAGAPTNAIALTGTKHVIAVSANTYYVYDTFLIAPAEKYPYVLSGGVSDTHDVHLWGYEV
tara:strand:+ start:66 stop:479 length:414 start_codon:yes stop_codon:yes gene_type:complete